LRESLTEKLKSFSGKKVLAGKEPFWALQDVSFE
jgi:hypothetical protein